MQLGYKTIKSGHGTIWKPTIYVEPKTYLFGLIKVGGYWEELSEYDYDMDMDVVETFLEERKVEAYLKRYIVKVEQERIREGLDKVPVKTTYTKFPK